MIGIVTKIKSKQTKQGNLELWKRKEGLLKQKEGYDVVLILNGEVQQAKFFPSKSEALKHLELLEQEINEK